MARALLCSGARDVRRGITWNGLFVWIAICGAAFECQSCVRAGNKMVGRRAGTQRGLAVILPALWTCASQEEPSMPTNLPGLAEMAILVAVSSRALARARALGGAERCQGKNGAPADVCEWIG